MAADAESSFATKSHSYFPTFFRSTRFIDFREIRWVRIRIHIDVIDPEPWLRNKTEMDAVLADLQVAYDEAIPFLHNQSRSLQEAVHRAKIATEFGAEGRKDFFLKNIQSAKPYASLPPNQGIESGFVKEGISELDNALSLAQDRLGAATTFEERGVSSLEFSLTTDDGLGIRPHRA